MRIVDGFTIGHPAERVWPYLAELERRLEFIPQLVEMKRISTGPVEPGAEWKGVTRVGLWIVASTDRLTDFEPETRVAWETSAPWNARTEYRLEALGDDQSVVHLDFEAHPSGWLGLMDWLPDSLLKRAMSDDYQRLEKLLDEQSQPL